MVITEVFSLCIRSMNDETFIGLGATKSAVHQCRGITNVSIIKELLRVTEKSHHMYQEHKRQEQMSKSKAGEAIVQKEAHKRK